MKLSFSAPRIQPLLGVGPNAVSTAVLRLDELHPVVSGNKWFKLNPYVQDAKASGRQTLLTFGGPYSNHLVATAAAAQAEGMKSIGIVRGEEPRGLSHTLQTARAFGMELHFSSREAFRQQALPESLLAVHDYRDLYAIAQGGYGWLGTEGAADILNENTASFSHIVCAVGTGTTLAGLVRAAQPHQTIVGISVLKNAVSLCAEINALLPPGKTDDFLLRHDFHFGGYAKHNPELLRFMNEFYRATGIPTDFVYTGKAFYAAAQLLNEGFFPAGSRVLLLHTGGLQGNASLKKGLLIYPTD